MRLDLLSPPQIQPSTEIMNPLERSQQIVRFLSSIPDFEERFTILLSKAKRMPVLEEKFKTDSYRVEGCLSNLWLVSEIREGRVYFRADSDALIPKGIIALLIEVYSGGTPQEILDLDTAFLQDAGLAQFLSMNRSNGLAQICRKIKRYALLAQRPEHSPPPNLEDS